jgi:UPF0042 nucleotide-binding protein
MAMKKDTQQTEPQLVLISGLAGSGYSTALNVLADMGYFAVDNLPLALVDKLISLEVETEGRRLAVSLDGRTSGFDEESLADLMADIRRRLKDGVKLIFLSAQEDVLYQRFNATRRHHPLDRTGDLKSAIREDWSRMGPIESLADISIDTSAASPTQLRSSLLLQLGLDEKSKLPVLIQSFSYRYGIPQDADMVLDMRFVENPHWQPGLAAQTGLDKDVQAFIGNSKVFTDAMKNFSSFLKIALPRFAEEGRPKFSIAVGCTGGRHRSVFAAVKLAEMIEAMGHETAVTHREIRPGKWPVK